MRIAFYSLFFSLLIVLSGCGRDEPAFPVYLKLEGARVKLGEGNFTSDIAVKDFWMSHNANDFGVHRIPRVVPMIPEERGNAIFINGGVFENGLSGFRLPYPFWRAFAVEIEANPLDTVSILPTFEYLNPDTVIKIAFDANFETSSSPGFTDFSQSNNSTQLSKSTTAAFQGTWGARADFSATRYELEALSTVPVRLPQVGGNDVWMEITFKNTVPFTTGLAFAVPSTGEAGNLDSGVFLDSKGEWVTAYIHVNQQVRSIIGTALFTPYIRATSLNLQTGKADQGSIFIDNIRILHFR